jgi:LPS O-antigen subunit length determinant protein (WzzB/FepE family)
MKKKDIYLADDEIDLKDLIKSLWREKIIILSVSIICGLTGYLYSTLQQQEFKTEFEIKYSPSQLFYNYINELENKNNDNITKEKEIITIFKLNFLSLDNMKSFFEKSTEFDNFKVYLKSRNTDPKLYFNKKRFGRATEENKFFIVSPKKLDQIVFINNYIEFSNNKTISDFKNIIKQEIIKNINIYEESIEVAKQINLEKPILQMSIKTNQIGHLYNNGTQILTKQVYMSKAKLAELEREQFKSIFILYKISTPIIISKSPSLYSFSGMIFGFLLSLIIIFFKNLMKK